MPVAPSSPPFRRPPLPLLLTEAPRAALEFGALAASWSALLAAPLGDGHPVLVLPGLFATDAYTAVLRAFLRSRGYAVAGWRAGRNWGHWDDLDRAVLPALEALQARHGRKASIVGASMGGLYARAAAHRRPDLVRNVITLSSAAQPAPEGTYAAPVYELLTGQPGDTLWAPPAPLPCTSVFSRADGVSDWRPALVAPGPQAENVEVASSHVGLCWHPAVLHLLADRLAQPESAWRPFAPPAWAQWLYPRGAQAATEAPA